MTDYKDIGARIRQARRRCHMTQEQLAELVGVGVTHISHIETGSSIPSLPIFIAIVNALGCSADELLCIELHHTQPLFQAWVSDLLGDCSDVERKLIADTILSLKASMRRLHITTDHEHN